jgi:uncharacterized protein (TIGR01370 family)
MAGLGRAVGAALWRLLSLLSLLLAVAVAAAGPAFAGEIPWAVVYSDSPQPRELTGYRLVVLDSHAHPALMPLKDRGVAVLGYLSVGEVENNRPWFARVKEWGILGDENPTWRGSYYVDVRDPRWVKLVVEELVPDILHRGFDGVFLDTLDNPPFLEAREPRRFAGMTQAAARLVRAIRHNYPDIGLMQNRGFEILPATAPFIDYALAESVHAAWNFETRTASPRPEADMQWALEALRAAREINPRLEAMSLDYWDPADAAGMARLYALARSHGFSPYVSVVELDRVIPEPGPPPAPQPGPQP